MRGLVVELSANISTTCGQYPGFPLVPRKTGSETRVGASHFPPWHRGRRLCAARCAHRNLTPLLRRDPGETGPLSLNTWQDSAFADMLGTMLGCLLAVSSRWQDCLAPSSNFASQAQGCGETTGHGHLAVSNTGQGHGASWLRKREQTLGFVPRAQTEGGRLLRITALGW